MLSFLVLGALMLTAQGTVASWVAAVPAPPVKISLTASSRGTDLRHALPGFACRRGGCLRMKATDKDKSWKWSAATDVFAKTFEDAIEMDVNLPGELRRKRYAKRMQEGSPVSTAQNEAKDSLVKVFAGGLATVLERILDLAFPGQLQLFETAEKEMRSSDEAVELLGADISIG